MATQASTIILKNPKIAGTTATFEIPADIPAGDYAVSVIQGGTPVALPGATVRIMNRAAVLTGVGPIDLRDSSREKSLGPCPSDAIPMNAPAIAFNLIGSYAAGATATAKADPSTSGTVCIDLAPAPASSATSTVPWSVVLGPEALQKETQLTLSAVNPPPAEPPATGIKPPTLTIVPPFFVNQFTDTAGTSLTEAHPGATVIFHGKGFIPGISEVDVHCDPPVHGSFTATVPNTNSVQVEIPSELEARPNTLSVTVTVTNPANGHDSRDVTATSYSLPIRVRGTHQKRPQGKGGAEAGGGSHDGAVFERLAEGIVDAICKAEGTREVLHAIDRLTRSAGHDPVRVRHALEGRLTEFRTLEESQLNVEVREVLMRALPEKHRH
jgi:hypothetical protein